MKGWRWRGAGGLSSLAAALVAIWTTAGVARGDLTIRRAGADLPWPAGTDVVPFELRHGLVLVRAALASPSGRDTSGLFVFDTGSPVLAVRAGVWNALLLDTLELGLSHSRLVRRPLSRFELGPARLDGVEIGGVLADSVMDEDVLGIFAPSLLGDHAVVLDYDARELAILSRTLTVIAAQEAQPGGAPAGVQARTCRSRARLGSILSRGAVPVPFRRFQGGRMLVSARIEEDSGEWRSRPLTLLLDTGASGSVLFADAVAERVTRAASWPRRSGQRVRTVLGDVSADLTLLPRLLLTDVSPPIALERVQAGVVARPSFPDIQGELPDPVHGLLGYSFLGRFRVVLDYLDELLWLDADREAPGSPRRSRIGGLPP